MQSQGTDNKAKNASLARQEGLPSSQNQSKGYKNSDSHKKLVQQNNSHTQGKQVKIDWGWPAKGKVIKKFSVQEVGSKGIKIAGHKGEPVRAAADGKVVYSGSGLVGYGNLIIIKHNSMFLSAYAHNSRLAVKEGENIKAGEKIAEIGSSGTDRNQLHFEIRREGKPLDPLGLLPQQRG